MLFNSALEDTIRKVQQNKQGLYLNSTHQNLVQAHYVNLLDISINITKKGIQALLDASNKVCVLVTLPD